MFVLDPETGKYRWEDSFISSEPGEVNRKALQDQQTLDAKRSQEVFRTANQIEKDQGEFSGSMEVFHKNPEAGQQYRIPNALAAAESIVPQAKRIPLPPATVSELSAGGVDVVSKEESVTSPISPREALSRIETEKQLTPEQQQANLDLLSRKITAERWKEADEKKQRIKDSIAPTGLMSGKMARMAVASDNKFATPKMLDAVERTMDAAAGLTDTPISSDDLEITMQALRKKGNITGLTQDMTRSLARLQLAVNENMASGKSIMDSELSKGNIKTISDWNKVIDNNFSPVTRDMARAKLYDSIPEHLLIIENMDEANSPRFAEWLQKEKRFDANTASRYSTTEQMHNVAEDLYNEFKQSKVEGSFYDDGNGKIKEHHTDAATLKLRAEKEAFDIAEDKLASGLVVSATDPAVKRVLEANGLKDAARFEVESSALSSDLKKEFPTSKMSVTNYAGGVVELLAKGALEAYRKGKNIPDSIKSTINDFVERGVIKGDNIEGIYSTFGREVLPRMQSFFNTEKKKVSDRLKAAKAEQMKSLNNRLVQVVDDRVVPNATTFPELTAGQLEAQVSNNNVDWSNYQDIAKDLLKQKLGLTPDSAQGKTLDFALSLSPEEMSEVYGPIAIALKRVEGDLSKGLLQKDSLDAVFTKEQENKAALREQTRLNNEKNGLITDWIDKGNGNMEPVTFRTESAHQAWARADDLGKKNIAEFEKTMIEDHSKKEVEISQDLARLKSGQVIIPKLVKYQPNEFGTAVSQFAPKSVIAQTESDWDEGYDYINEKYGGHPDLMEKAVATWENAHDKWIKDTIASEKWNQDIWFKSFRDSKPVDMETVVKSFEKLKTLSGTEEDINKALDKLEKDVPGIKKFAMRQEATATGKEQRSLSNQPPRQSTPSAGTEKNGYRFKGGDPADQNNWEKI